MFYYVQDVKPPMKEKIDVGGLTQDDQVTSAPRAVKVSMRTAVWIVL